MANEEYKKIHNWGAIKDVYDEALKTAKKGDIIVEVGVWLGSSVGYLDETAKKLGKEIEIHAVDVFGGVNVARDMQEQGVLDGDDHLKKFKANMDNLGVEVTIHRADSVMEAYTFKDDSLHCVYLDADHDFEAVVADIVAYFPKLKKGGIMGGHDWLNTDVGVRRAVEYFCKRFGYEVKVTTEEWPSWYFIK